MNFFLIICFISFLTLNSLFAQNQSYNYIFYNDPEKILNDKYNEIKSKEKKVKSLKKLVILFTIKNKFKDNFLNYHFNKEKYTFSYQEKYFIFKLVYNNIQKDLKREEEFFEKLKKEYLSSIKVNKKDSAVYDPLTANLIQNPIKFEYNKKLKAGIFIKSPISGIIKKIGFSEGTIIISIENEVCRVTIEGLDKINVSLGEVIKAKEIIGESADIIFYFKVICNKQ